MTPVSGNRGPEGSRTVELWSCRDFGYKEFGLQLEMKSAKRPGFCERIRYIDREIRKLLKNV